jgi:hypothetical protein
VAFSETRGEMKKACAASNRPEANSVSEINYQGGAEFEPISIQQKRSKKSLLKSYIITKDLSFCV